jgi:glycosyltransferase involved in cell wall biosynthesis
MKICILGPITTASYFGGVASFDEDLAMGFHQNGHDVAIVTSQKDTNKKLLNGHIPVITVRSKHDFCKWQEIEKPELIIGSLAYPRLLSQRWCENTKVIYFLHGYFTRSYYGFLKSTFASIYQKHLAQKADYIFANSHFTSMINREFFGIKAHKAIHLGVSEDFYKQSASFGINDKEQGTILFVGRLVSAKGVNKLIDAAKILSDRGIAYRIQIAGDGPERTKLEEYARKNSLSVNFLGKIDHKQISELYRYSEVFVSLNPSEPFGITFVEALLSNCKILCPETGGQVEFLRHWYESVAFVEESSAMCIADGIMKLFAKGEYPELSNEERATYSYKSIATAISDFVEERR